MDIQFRRGILEVCVLSVLEQGESYGYQLIKDIGKMIEITESTLYPILKRLEAGQMLTVISMEYNGRLRKYYKITDKGKERVTDFLREWQEITKVYQAIADGREKIEHE